MPTKKATRRSANLAAAVAAVNEQYGADAVMTLRKAVDCGMLDVGRIPTGIIAVDGLLLGGIPKGKIVEIFGPEGAGKTTLVLRVAAQVLREGGNVLWLDIEKSIDVGWAKYHGIDIHSEKFHLSQPQDGQQAGNILHAMAATGLFNLIVVDSIGALVPRAELEKGMEQEFIGAQPKQVNRIARDTTSALNTRQEAFKANQTAVVFINQIRIKIGQLFGSGMYAPGGEGKNHAVHLRVAVVRKKNLTHERGGKKRKYGQTVGVQVQKSKMATLLAPYTFDLYSADANGFHKGDVDNAASLIEFGIEFGLLRVESGGRIKVVKTGKVHKKAELLERLRDNPDKLWRLWATVQKEIPSWRGAE